MHSHVFKDLEEGEKISCLKHLTFNINIGVNTNDSDVQMFSNILTFYQVLSEKFILFARFGHF